MNRCSHKSQEPHFDYDLCLKCGEKIWCKMEDGQILVGNMIYGRGLPIFEATGKRTRAIVRDEG